MRYRVRDTETLRRLIKEPRRLVPHSVRSLAEQAKTHKTTIDRMLNDEGASVDESVAQSVAEVFERPVDDLFVPDGSTSIDGANGPDRQEGIA